MTQVTEALEPRKSRWSSGATVIFTTSPAVGDGVCLGEDSGGFAEEVVFGEKIQFFFE